MMPIVRASIVCYSPDNYGIMYEYEDGSIGGCKVGVMADAVREVTRINAERLLGVGPSKTLGAILVG
jgi:hypothetical protein